MLKNWLRKIAIITLELVIITGALWFIVQKKGIKTPEEIIPALQETISDTTKQFEKEKSFPEITGQIQKNFNWEYGGVKYSLSENLHQSTYDYYKSLPKTFPYSGELPNNWQELYYAMFLKINDGDNSIATLAADLQTLGKKHNLSDDQIVDLALAFVQAISYDDAKAKNILAKTGNESMRFPYEVLWEQSGVCSDKSLLLTVLLRQMGYGATLFAYEEDNHMAVGIECPKDYSTYGSGYCYAETTSVGNKIGIIPDFDKVTNKTISARTISNFDANQQQQIKVAQLGQVTMYQQTSARLYAEIIQTIKTINDINDLKKKLNSMSADIQDQKKTIASEYQDLQDIKKASDKYQKNQDIENYNALADKFNKLLANYNSNVKKFNSNVSIYNKIVAQYNALVVK